MLLDAFLSQFIQTTDFPTLDAMKYLMENLGSPEKDLKFIHVAGTNGKGSICEMLNNILILSNYKVGKFISPHLIVSNESICINNVQITDNEFLEYKEKFEKLAKDYFNKTKRSLTRFEILTALGILYFKEQKCDIVLLEVGLGGMYDCTNIVNSLISVFGSIGFDHTAILGNTLEEIATQKAGIIKENSNTVIFEQPALSVIEKHCYEKNSKLHIIKNEEVSNYSFDSSYQYFDYLDFKNLCINLKGKKQIENACIAIQCSQTLEENGFEISKEKIYEGLKTVVHPARFEELSKKPRIIFDGAHNENAMYNFIDTVNSLFPKENKTFLVSIITTKDYQKILDLLLNAFENCTFIFTDGTIPDKFFKAEVLYDFAKTLNTSNKLELSNFNEGISKLKSEINFIVRKLLCI